MPRRGNVENGAVCPDSRVIQKKKARALRRGPRGTVSFLEKGTHPFKGCVPFGYGSSNATAT